jgi:ATP phosphoribosyltransferase regulatory subunit
VNIEAPLSELTARLSRLPSAGLATGKVSFAGQFGRNMEYYTGLVFEFRASNVQSPVAGGGRYDDLLTALGAPKRTPSVGLAIFCDRLVSAVSGARS